MNGQNKSVTSLEMSYEATPRHSVVRDACGKAKLNPARERRHYSHIIYIYYMLLSKMEYRYLSLVAG
ncbi:uncharacterized protein PHALS_01550 [Plasmopara halstedii]|uniref:Uncharacterized protein n=1 Tax=Plasmopara halstedii TaxID=4781 RepID=A0A0P1AV96_PLAHL|nr:uncharacterized protein PHALS_01550 [Plasmopara halstedii]CEG45240.1 hypothetical protein PHALS_01550 [Plasmopara halstedii]|eukprot:XP_024581609.1 hypothetical protein PHALS_01550 [Plasmopara halstedii]